MSAPVARRQAWLLATRPKTLPAAAAAVLVGWGTAALEGVFRPVPALACLLCALLLQVASNVANDYFDWKRGIDTAERLGPRRVTSGGLLPPGEVLAGLVAIIAAAFLIGVYLAFVGGWPIVAVGIASILSLLAYSSGPFPLSSHGLGDLFAFLFFGEVAVVGTHFVQGGAFSPLAAAAAVAPGGLITAILVVNNLRDIRTDAKVGKRTLAVMLGERGSRAEYLGLVVAAYLVPPVLWVAGRASAWVLLSWLSLPLAARAVRAIHDAADGPAFNRLLAATARLALAHSVLFAAGLALGH